MGGGVLRFLRMLCWDSAAFPFDFRIFCAFDLFLSDDHWSWAFFALDRLAWRVFVCLEASRGAVRCGAFGTCLCAMSGAAEPVVGPDGEEVEEEEIIVKDPAELMEELIVASKAGDMETAKEVLANDNLMPTREVDAKGRVKWGPLMWAVNKGHQKLATLLLEHGFAGPFQAAVSERAKFLEDEGGGNSILGVSTPLHWAAMKGHLIILIELIEIYQFSVSGRDERGNTPLHLAAAGAPRGDQKAPQFLKVMEILLSEGADVHSKNYYGNTALDLCCNSDGRLLLKKVMMARQTADTTADDAMEDEMAGLDLLSISRMREDQQQLLSLTDKVRAEMSTDLLDGLEKALVDAERSFVSANEIAISRKVLGQLEAKRKVEERMEMVNAYRPLQKSSDALPLKDALEEALEAGVSANNLESATILIDAVTAEVKLFSVNSSCKAITCATLADTGQRNALENALKRATLLEVDEDLLTGARFVLKRLDAEIELQACLSMRFKLSEAEQEGKHETTIRILTLEPQVQRLQRALTLANVGGVNEELLERAKEKLASLEAEFQEAKDADAERLKAEEEAAMKAAKKKKGKGKKKGK